MMETDPPKSAQSIPIAGATELDAVRHDLKNLLTALRSGCILIDAQLGEGGHEVVREFLGEMRAAIQDGSAIVSRLQEIQVNSASPSGAPSVRSSSELAE